MNKTRFVYVLLSVVLFVACQNSIDIPEEGMSIEETRILNTDAQSASNNNSGSAADYYEYNYPEYLKEQNPYTYMMNKYLDLALDYLGEWSFGIVDMDIYNKKELLSSVAHSAFLDREDVELESTEEDIFFAELYDNLSTELNTFPVIQEYLTESSSVVDDEDIILPLDGGNGYSKFTILYCYENNLSLEHEQYSSEDYTEDSECGCEHYVEQPAKTSVQRRLIRYDLLSKWLTDIRYRNYKNRCPNMDNMREAMNEWEEASNYAIHFVEIKDNGWNRFSWGIGCNYHVCISDNVCGESCGVSSLGAVPWAYIHINTDCPYKGTCLHELGHTLTLEHEQCRPDRDCYINVNFKNMNCSSKIQFHKFLDSSTTAYGPFDFESIMLYDSYAYSNNGLPTMTKKDGSTFEAQRDHLSDGDKMYIRNIYY